MVPRRVTPSTGFLFVILILLGVGCREILPGTSSSPPSFTPPTGTSAIEVAEQPGTHMENQFRLVGYYASWNVYDRSVFLSQIRAGKITHLNYAFSAINAEGVCALGDPEADTLMVFGEDVSVDGQEGGSGEVQGNFRQLMLLKRKYPGLKVLISIGGWSGSDRFSEAAHSADSRKKLVASCVDLYLVQFADAFDGIDVDWEFPVKGGLQPGSTEDKRNFTFLLEEFRRQMDILQTSTGRRYLLTIAAPADASKMQNLELGEIHRSLDWINLMTYDFHSPTEERTGLLSPLYGSPRDPDPESRKFLNADAAARGYLAAGVPAEKILLGIPFYGAVWQGAQGDGLFSVASGPATSSEEPGVMSYTQILQGPLAISMRYWEEDAKVPWLYNAETGIFISYEDADSISWKVRYIQENRLGGAMVWELGLDSGILLRALSHLLFSQPQ